MTQEDKELLLRDLCSRLPYGVKVLTYKLDYFHNPSSMETLYEINEDGYISTVESDTLRPIGKPYLFPLSSMTEEQSMELFKLFGISLVDSIGADYIKINECTGITFFLNQGFDVETHLDKLIEWLNKNHFDYRCLIEKGIAIEAPEGMYN